MCRDLPVVFACSGSSNSGQLANLLALTLDRRGIAEMSCLAGLAAGKRQFLGRLAGREVWVLDGCATSCGKEIVGRFPGALVRYLSLDALGIHKDSPLPEGPELEAVVAKMLNGLCENNRQSDPAAQSTP
jgi:uncharacterized metal-binding protein